MSRFFGPNPNAVKAMAAVLDAPAGGFAGTPFHARISDAYRDGAGFLICADLPQSHIASEGKDGLRTGGLRYFIGGQKEVNQKTELRASLGFEGQRTGIASWLAEPAPMGSLDYISPEATLVTAFVVRNPATILDQLAGVAKPLMRGEAHSAAADAHAALSKTLGGEFSLSVDGPLVPVPSWKVVG